MGVYVQLEFRANGHHARAYPLSRLVKLKPDTKKNGVWAGNYEEFAGGKK